MKRRGLQLRPLHRRILYAVGAALFLTGTVWAWIHHLDEQGRAGESLQRSKQWLIEIHGFAAMFFVLLLGTLLTGHVRRAWHAHKSRRNGVFFLTSVSLLTLSGYALYYISGENFRAAVSRFHLWLGIIAPALLLLHITLGRKKPPANSYYRKRPLLPQPSREFTQHALRTTFLIPVFTQFDSARSPGKLPRGL
jgi:hypothetical protein